MKHGSRGEEFRLSKHAQFQMQRRAISAEEVFQVLNAPEQIHFVGQGRAIYPSRTKHRGRLYLLPGLFQILIKLIKSHRGTGNTEKRAKLSSLCSLCLRVKCLIGVVEIPDASRRVRSPYGIEYQVRQAESLA